MDSYDGPSAAVRLSPRHGIIAEKFNPAKQTKMNQTKKSPKSPAQVVQIRKCVKKLFLFEGLNNNQIDEIIDFMFMKSVKKNEIIINENDYGDYFYVIQSGTYDISKGDKLLKRYENSGYFGELALLYNTPRNATVKATSDGELWGLDRITFQQNVLHLAYEKRLRSETLIRKLDVFRGLPDSVLMSIIDSMTYTQLTNTVLFKTGDNNHTVYFLENGEVEIIKTVGGKDEVIRTLKAGTSFGEETVLLKRPSSFTARTKNKATLGTMESEIFISHVVPRLGECKRLLESFLQSLG